MTGNTPTHTDTGGDAERSDGENTDTEAAMSEREHQKREHWREGARKRAENPSTREKLREQTRANWKQPEVRAKRQAGLRRMTRDLAGRQKRSAGMRAAWADPVQGQRLRDGHAHHQIKDRDQFVAHHKAAWTPDKRAAQAELTRRRKAEVKAQRRQEFVMVLEAQIGRSLDRLRQDIAALWATIEASYSNLFRAIEIITDELTGVTPTALIPQRARDVCGFFRALLVGATLPHYEQLNDALHLYLASSTAWRAENDITERQLTRLRSDLSSCEKQRGTLLRLLDALETFPPTESLTTEHLRLLLATWMSDYLAPAFDALVALRADISA